MQYSIWKNRFVLGIIFLVLGASVFPSTSGNFLGKNEDINTNIPVWKIGDSWTYNLDLNFQFVESDAEISIDISTANLNFKVDDDSGDSYHLNINGDISGDFTFTIEGYPSVKGSLKDTKILGTSSIEQTTLGIEELNIQIDGRLSLLGLVPIPLDAELLATFDPSYHTLSFPLIVGNEWNVDSSTINLEGRIVLPGITKLFLNIPEEIPINISDFPIGGTKAYCIGKEPVDVIAGQYTAYNITFNYDTVVYFAAAAGNFISIVPSLNNFDEYQLEFNCELVSTTYIDPEAPKIPSTPTGSKRGNLKTEYTYSSSTTDPQGDTIYYLYDWDDGSDSGWLGPYNSGVTCDATHQWSKKGNYNIRVQAKDANGAESHWSGSLPIKMPYSFNKTMSRCLGLLFQQFPQHISNSTIGDRMIENFINLITNVTKKYR